MKLNKFVLTLTAAVLLPAFAYAGATNSAPAVTGEPDSFTVQFNTALYGTDDPVLASFERDMYREPIDAGITVAGETDVLTLEFYAALRDVLDRPAMHAAAGNSRPGS